MLHSNVCQPMIKWYSLMWYPPKWFYEQSGPFGELIRGAGYECDTRCRITHEIGTLMKVSLGHVSIRKAITLLLFWWKHKIRLILCIHYSKVAFSSAYSKFLNFLPEFCNFWTVTKIWLDLILICVRVTNPKCSGNCEKWFGRTHSLWWWTGGHPNWR